LEQGTANDVSVYYFAILTRLLLANPEFFLEFFRTNGRKAPYASQNVSLLAQWVDRLYAPLLFP